MSKFRIEACMNSTYYRVEMKFLWWWNSGYVHTNYFGIQYDSVEDAKKSIEGYKNRYTEVD